MKLVLIGDCDVGKTSLLTAFTTGTISLSKLSGLFEVYTSSIIVDSENVDIECWYTSAAETCDSRCRCYQDASAILICFAANDCQSFESAKSKWHHEARLYAPEVPLFFVKTKSDRKNAPNFSDLISTEMGEKAAEELKVCAYMECSSHYSNESVQKIFQAVARQVRALGVPEALVTERPGLKSWMQNRHDVELVEEAIRFGANRDHLASEFSAALYLDTFRAQGHYVCTKPAWVITKDDFDIYYQAFRIKCKPAQYATKQRALLFIDQMRAEGRAVYLPPTWVTDESTTELYTTAVAKGAPPHALNSLKETKLFLLGVDDTPHGLNNWFLWWTT